MQEIQIDSVRIKIYDSAKEMGLAAAEDTSSYLKTLPESMVNLLFSTGASQFTFMDGLKAQTIDWKRVNAYHLDEYKGMSQEHPASFRLWIRERIEKVFNPNKVEYIQGDAADTEEECKRYARLIEANPIELGFIGIGENGHIAFNDPPVADFNDEFLVKVVELDDACRRQQLGEGWFKTLADVPTEALTLTVPAIMRCKKIFSIVPDGRKAQAVYDALKGPVSTKCPASILRTHGDVTLYLDRDSAALII